MSDDAAHARIESALRDVGAEHAPPAGWQARVFAAIERPRPARRMWWVVAPAVAAAALLVTWLAWPKHGAPELALNVTVDRTGSIVRGTSAHVGDTLRAEARGPRHVAIWVYRNDRELVIACPGAQGCSATPESLAGHAVLSAVGDYTVVALSADAALPPPHGILDEDVAAASRAGARYRMTSIAVR